jgi:hypothetical protein
MSENATYFHRLVMQPTMDKGNMMDLRLLTLEEALQDRGEGVVD